MADETKSKFGVPVQGADSGTGILMPKLKYRFRVNFLGIGGDPRPITLTQNIQSVQRPKVGYEEVPVESYNSKIWVQGKHTWEAITVTLRDDITNSVTKLIGKQMQRQVNHFQQTTAASAGDFKFDMEIEILDGSNRGGTEKWFLEGCFLTNVDYSDGDYSTNDHVQIILTVRYDNATHYAGDNDSDGRVSSENPFIDAVEGILGNTITG